ncbi:PREDICTED: plasminogen activator inhibitor 1 RNA-binding protein-like isoform X1 [Camelina sativa]|uniref:Plasminogen activator inhibitor 1 RNA-binding protein-like isoform X1 n=1 Tax=Camelina sativa TaxID=90675 RepID=A0ABM0V276_CAMSA|nr:PREDICTED: plasminogen activator inhibitor 1 RNA-binding protein-like isoform X1 [Camelina sativa]
MATLNPFDLLGDDVEDPSQLAVSIEKTDKSKKSGPVSGLPAKSTPKLPFKPLPPAQAVREARSDAPRGGRGGFSRGRGGYNRDDGNNGYSGEYSKPSEEGDVSKSSYERRAGGGGAPRGSFRGEGGGGGRRGGFSNESGEGERPRRTYERRSGTGRGGDFKRDGSGRGNWGTPGEELAAETEAVAGVDTEKAVGEKPAVDADANKENTAEVEEKEPEDKEMTLDEYEKILEEKKKALQSLTTSERKVDTKVFESMQQLSNKKANDEIFIKLGSDKDKRKDDKEEKAKKAVSINEFLKPAEGENYYRGGRGGRGRGGRGRGRGGVSNEEHVGYRNEAAPAIEDTAQFPSLGGK